MILYSGVRRKAYGAFAIPRCGIVKTPFIHRHCEPEGRSNPFITNQKKLKLPVFSWNSYSGGRDCFVVLRAPRNDLNRRIFVSSSAFSLPPLFFATKPPRFTKSIRRHPTAYRLPPSAFILSSTPDLSKNQHTDNILPHYPPPPCRLMV